MSVEEAERLCDRFIEGAVRGVFFVPFEHQVDREDVNRRIANKLRQAGIPVVLLDRDLGAFPNRSTHDLVQIDNFAGGYFLAEHLVKLGLQRIVYVTRPLTASTVDGRIAGARAALGANGIDVPRNFVQFGDPGDPKFVRALGRIGNLEAVICTSDHVAAELIQTLNRLGIRVPHDLRMVGFDNVPFAGLLTVPLTTMEQPTADIATTAFQALLERIVEPTRPIRTLTLSPRLVVRESCGAYLQEKRSTTRSPVST